MLTKEIKEAYLEHLTENINDRDYTDIDVFILDYDIDEEDVDKLLNMQVKVIEDNGQ